MKTLLIGLMIISTTVLAAEKTKHQTATGKYPIYYANVEGQNNDWDDEMQLDYDDKMDNAILEYCLAKGSVANAEAVIAHEKEVGKMTGLVDKTAIHQAGSTIVKMKPQIVKLGGIIKEGTHKEADSYECP